MNQSVDTELINEKLQKIKLLAMDVDGVLTDGRVYFDIQGNEKKAFHFKDIMGISRLIKNGIKVALISGEDNIIIDNFAKKMKIEKIYKGCKEKDKAILDLSEFYKFSTDEICFIGDDVNDIPALKIAGFAVTVPDCFEEVKKHVHLITHNNGGFGAVREICEMIINNQVRRGE